MKKKVLKWDVLKLILDYKYPTGLPLFANHGYGLGDVYKGEHKLAGDIVALLEEEV